MQKIIGLLFAFSYVPTVFAGSCDDQLYDSLAVCRPYQCQISQEIPLPAPDQGFSPEMLANMPEAVQEKLPARFKNGANNSPAGNISVEATYEVVGRVGNACHYRETLRNSFAEEEQVSNCYLNTQDLAIFSTTYGFPPSIPADIQAEACRLRETPEIIEFENNEPEFKLKKQPNSGYEWYR